jgi:hypothetical protein
VFSTLASTMTVGHAARGVAIVGIVAASAWGWTATIVAIAAAAAAITAIQALAAIHRTTPRPASRVRLAGAHA